MRPPLFLVWCDVTYSTAPQSGSIDRIADSSLDPEGLNSYEATTVILQVEGIMRGDFLLPRKIVPGPILGGCGILDDAPPHDVNVVRPPDGRGPSRSDCVHAVEGNNTLQDRYL